jgi:hypothetical protein
MASPRAVAPALWWPGFWSPACSALVALVIGLVGCAPALPSFSGGRTTPDGREDLGLGASVRVPLGDLARPQDGPLLGLMAPGGIAPAGFFRIGIARGWDLGVLVAGPNGRLELRTGIRLGPSTRFHAGLSGYGGGLVRETSDVEGGGDGYRVGALVPIVFALDLGGILEAWAGARLGFEHVGGQIVSGGVMLRGDGTAFRGGLLVGLAIGFRRVHALLELAADYEYWRGHLAGVSFERQGVALVPSFGLRVRF